MDDLISALAERVLILFPAPSDDRRFTEAPFAEALQTAGTEPGDWAALYRGDHEISGITALTPALATPTLILKSDVRFVPTMDWVQPLDRRAPVLVDEANARSLWRLIFERNPEATDFVRDQIGMARRTLSDVLATLESWDVLLEPLVRASGVASFANVPLDAILVFAAYLADYANTARSTSVGVIVEELASQSGASAATVRDVEQRLRLADRGIESILEMGQATLDRVQKTAPTVHVEFADKLLADAFRIHESTAPDASGLATHHIVAALTGSLAAANHFRWKDQAMIEPFVVVPQQPAVTTDTAPAVTTDAAPAVTCDSTMDDLRHGRLGPFAFHDMEENVIAAIDSDAIWPGRHVLVVHAQRDGGNHPPSRTLVIGCEGDRARALLEAEGTPSVDGAALKIETAHLLSNDSNCCPSLQVTRTLAGSGDQLLETEPRVEVAVNGHGNAIADAPRYAGRYVLEGVAGGGMSEAPMEDFMLQPDGFFFARHGQDYEPPYTAGSFEYGTWQPSADGAIALKPMRGSEVRLTSGTEEDVLTLDTNHGIFTYSPPGYPRDYWTHAQGAFQRTGPKEWGERNANGETTLTFVEQARTPEYVELYDASRGCGVRLSATEALVRCANFDWTQFYRGKWDVEPGD